MAAPGLLPFSVDVNPLTKSVVVTVHSNKGGVGKTALVTMLGYYLAWVGYRVMLIDYDGQHNLSNNCGLFMSGSDANLYSIDDVLSKTREGFVREVLETPRWTIPGPGGLVPDPVNERVSLVPGYPDLDDKALELVMKPDARFRLRAGLTGVRDDFHIVLIDGPPGKGFLPDSAWAASNHAIGISPMYYNEIEGLIKSRNRIIEFRDSLGVPTLDVVGVIVNEYKAERVEQQAQLKDLRATLGEDLVWIEQAVPEREYIRRLVTHAERLSFGGLGRPIPQITMPDGKVKELDQVGTLAQRRELDRVMGSIMHRFLKAIDMPEAPALTEFLQTKEVVNAGEA